MEEDMSRGELIGKMIGGSVSAIVLLVVGGILVHKGNKEQKGWMKAIGILMLIFGSLNALGVIGSLGLLGYVHHAMKHARR